MKLPKLYKLTKLNAIQTYQVEVVDNTITVTQGQLNGKLQSYTTIITEGKNIGKANSTTPETQAILETTSKHEKKLKAGYTLDPSGTITVQLPRKVGKWEPKRFKPGLISTYKLNGINAIFKRTPNTGIITIYSRGGQIYPSIPHIESSMLQFMKAAKHDVINCELYIHGEHLQDITSAVKKSKQLSTRLEAAIFDICDSDEPYYLRRQILEFTVPNTYSSLRFLTGIEVQTLDDVENHYNQAIALGYEGTVIYSPHNLYKHNERASDIWKYKKAQSAEFEVVSYEIDKNQCPVWVLESPGGLFKAKPKGNHEDNQALALIADQYLHKWATIEYEMLSKDNKPLKPIFIAFRNCDESGQPLE